jgi:hypothetical protein
MTTLVRLNSDLINRIRAVFINSAETIKKIGGVEIVDQDILPGILVTCGTGVGSNLWFKLDDVFVPLEEYELSNPDLGNKVIAVTLGKLIHQRLGLESGISDLLSGFSIWTSFESPFGVEIKYHRDLDGQVLMVQEIGKPNHPIYALEEAVNTDLSISPESITSSSILENRLWHILGDYILADRVDGKLISLGEPVGNTEETQGESV